MPIMNCTLKVLCLTFKVQFKIRGFFVAYQPLYSGGLLIGKEKKRLEPLFSLLSFWLRPSSGCG